MSTYVIAWRCCWSHVVTVSRNESPFVQDQMACPAIAFFTVGEERLPIDPDLS
jgi:hypothetical protein